MNLLASLMLIAQDTIRLVQIYIYKVSKLQATLELIVNMYEQTVVNGVNCTACKVLFEIADQLIITTPMSYISASATSSRTTGGQM